MYWSIFCGQISQQLRDLCDLLGYSISWCRAAIAKEVFSIYCDPILVKQWQTEMDKIGLLSFDNLLDTENLEL